MSHYSKASLPGQSSNLTANEKVVSIVHHPEEKSLEDNELLAIVEDAPSFAEFESKATYSIAEKQGLEQLLTPWTIGALLIILLANILLTWAQWSSDKPAPNQTNQSQSNATSKELSVSATSRGPQSESPATTVRDKSRTPARKQENLALSRLSLLTVSHQPTTSINSATQSGKKAPSSPKNQTLAQKKTSSLTNALLPPSLQPQLAQTYPVLVPPSPSLSQSLSVTPVNQPVNTTAPNQTPPTPPSIKPPVSQPSSINNNPDQKALLQQKLIFEQIQREQQQPQPLGFNHQTRAKLKSVENQQDPSQLIEQLQQLQQEKINSSNSNSQQTNQPKP